MTKITIQLDTASEDVHFEVIRDTAQMTGALEPSVLPVIEV